MILLSDADVYLRKHMFADKWTEVSNQENILNTAEMILKSRFTFREGAELTDNYFHAVCEQTMHLLLFEPDILKLQLTGVSFYMVDGMQFTIKNSLVSPIVKGFLRKITKARVGNII